MFKLISFSGLPGVGKTTLAREVARQIKAVHLRVDSAETAIQNSSLKINSAEDSGYLVLAYLAKDNLLLGLDVIVDTVNPIGITRKMWVATAVEAKATLVDVEIVCKDKRIHRERVETRTSDIEGLILPTWEKVVNRHYEPWTGDRLVVDTSKRTVSECAADIVAVLR